MARATAIAVAVKLRNVLAERGLSPRHAQDLLKAFRLDATKLRYENWDDLIGYCAYSAMPVGRYVLDVHGESRSTWPASDAICAALQINNHLQDCANDYRDLNRVYVPLDALAAAGTNVEALGAAKASPELRRCIAGLAKRTKALLHEGDALPVMVEDRRLGLEISVIVALADRIADHADRARSAQRERARRQGRRSRHCADRHAQGHAAPPRAASRRRGAAR